VCTERLQVHSYDVDFSRCLAVDALSRWCLEAAWNHAEQLGIGFAALAERKLLWVLSRLLVQIDAYPKWGEMLELSTWPRGINGVFALRDFEVRNLGGLHLASATSSWIVLSEGTHRPQRINKLLLHMPAEQRQAVGRDAAKIMEGDAGVVRLCTVARYSDIDVNHHVNSATYIRWLLDSYPAEFHQQHTIRRIELNYVGEVKWSDSVSVSAEARHPLVIQHSIRGADGAVACRAELAWRNR